VYIYSASDSYSENPLDFTPQRNHSLTVTSNYKMTLGKSIRIYLKEGSLTEIKFTELVNQTIQAFSCLKAPKNET
jgi:hypothetical protein